MISLHEVFYGGDPHCRYFHSSSQHITAFLSSGRLPLGATVFSPSFSYNHGRDCNKVISAITGTVVYLRDVAWNQLRGPLNPPARASEVGNANPAPTPEYVFIPPPAAGPVPVPAPITVAPLSVTAPAPLPVPALASAPTTAPSPTPAPTAEPTLSMTLSTPIADRVVHKSGHESDGAHTWSHASQDPYNAGYGTERGRPNDVFSNDETWCIYFPNGFAKIHPQSAPRVRCATAIVESSSCTQVTCLNQRL